MSDRRMAAAARSAQREIQRRHAVAAMKARLRERLEQLDRMLEAMKDNKTKLESMR
jgi:hypothetical protein